MATQIDVCNNALDLAGQGSHITSLGSQTKEADLCNRLLIPTIERAVDRFDWSFNRQNISITSSQLQNFQLPPFGKTYDLGTNVLRVLYLVPSSGYVDNRINYTKDYRFDFRLYNGSKYLITDAPAPFTAVCQVATTDLDLFPATVIEAIEFLLGGRLAASLMRGTNGLQVCNALLEQGGKLLESAYASDTKPELPTTDLCRKVCALIGVSFAGKTLEAQKQIAELCEELYPQQIKRCLEIFDWSFTRKSVTITASAAVTTDDEPYRKIYKLPSDFDRALFLTPASSDGDVTEYISDTRYDIRITAGVKTIATEIEAPFTLTYQAYTEDETLFPRSFIEGVENFVAGDLLTNFYALQVQQRDEQGGQVNLNVSQLLYQKGDSLLKGLQAMEPNIELPFSTKARRIMALVGTAALPLPLVAQRRAAHNIEVYLSLETERALAKYDWQFLRTDEYITSDFLLEDVANIPWQYTYTLPSDCRRPIYVTEVEAVHEYDRTHDYEQTPDFAVRRYLNKTVLCTNLPAPFVLHYVATETDEGNYPAPFVEAVELLVAGHIAPDLIQGEGAVQQSQLLTQQGMALLERAYQMDVPLGTYQNVERRGQNPIGILRSRL